MSKIDLRFRQIHLDFHTSEQIEGIGAEFDPEEFASTLEKARVNSITCFGRCHHGWIYFDTKAFPERRHPHLTRNLLKEQIEACHARNIRVPIYLTVQWDNFTADEHPEWLSIDADGRIIGTPPYQAGFYRSLCVNTPYLDFLKAHVQEVLETLPTDGLFFDIVQPQDCSCKYCRAEMEAEGLEPSDPEERRQYGLKIINNFKRDMTAFVRKFNEDCTIFYNAGHIGPRHRNVADTFSHFELESLPSGGWGYMHFPLAVRYARNLGIDCLGMTGKFHTSWGDFQSFKNEQALQFECFQMLAMGAKCSIGDQLHPSGKICQTTYNLVGSVYSEVEEKEPWCKGAKAVVDIAVFTPEEFTGNRVDPTTIGVARMLQEGNHQFDIIDSASDLSGYKVVVLPDYITVSEQLADKLDRYLSQGGAVIASYRSGLNERESEFALKALGVKLKGDAPYSPDFIMPKGGIGKGLPETEHVMYLKGMEVEAEPGTEVLADVIIPYFNRTYKHFCSHRHTPSSGKVGYPGIVRNGRAIYFTHPIFTQYNQNAPRWCKKLFLNALDMLLPEPLIRLEAPTTTLATVNEQSAENRWVLHLLHYIPERRGQDFDIIEDMIPIFDVKISVKALKRVDRIVCVPEQTPLKYEDKNGRIEFVLPKLQGHQMIALNFA
ncbi:TPA: beta-galactosidase [Candidatus Poribacteria bacterium]|nr:beta-galactosidase [Candidatus Poribacteria bacterium]